MHRLTAEGVGTALLLAAVVGSGIMGERLAAGNTAIALLANTIATGAALVALIFTFGSVSGAHFNPVVSFADASQGGLRWSEAAAYAVAQVLGAFAGVALADAMFDEPFYAWSQHVRSGGSQLLSEGVATFGLLAVIWGCVRRRPDAAPFAVGAYITAAYWFTASTSFANPAVTLARSVTDAFAGIRPVDVPAFLIGQIAGARSPRCCFDGSHQPCRLVLKHPSVPGLYPSNRVELSLKGQRIKGVNGQAREQTETGVESAESKIEGALLLFHGSFSERGILDAPVRGHRLTGPHRADLLCSAIAHGEHEIELLGAQLRELVPTLAA